MFVKCEREEDIARRYNQSRIHTISQFGENALNSLEFVQKVKLVRIRADALVRAEKKSSKLIFRCRSNRSMFFSLRD